MRSRARVAAADGRSHRCVPLGHGQVGGVEAPPRACEGGGERPSPVATAAGHATAARACSELCVFTNTPSTRGTVAGGPDFLVLLITAMYAWLLVACRPRSAVACDRPAGRRRDCRQQWAP